MMPAGAIIEQIRSAGVVIDTAGPNLVLIPPDRVPRDLIPELRRLKPEIMAALAAEEKADEIALRVRYWPVDWREEHRLECEALRQRAKATVDIDDRDELLGLIVEATTPEAHAIWWRKVNEAQNRLREEGRLPGLPSRRDQ